MQTFKHAENPDVQRLMVIVKPDGSLHWRFDEVTVEEWQQAYDAFQDFKYSSTDLRLFDLYLIQQKGVPLFQSLKQPDKALALSDWALADPDIQETRLQNWMQFYWLVQSRASLLLKQGQVEAGLQFYLDETRPLLAVKRSCTNIYIGGIRLFDDLNPNGASSGEPATLQAVQFLREVYSASFPKQALPAELGERPDGQTSSWGEIRMALLDLLGPPTRPSHNENPVINRLSVPYLEDGTEKPEATLEEFEAAVDSYKTFAYSSTEARLDDLDSLFCAGRNVLARLKRFDELLAFAEWTLSDEDVPRDPLDFGSPYWSALHAKTEALVRLGREHEAIKVYFHYGPQHMTGRYERRFTLEFGVWLFGFLHHSETDWQAPASPIAIEFARRLVKMARPKSKLPLPLREYLDDRTYSWERIHRVVQKLQPPRS